MASFYPAMHQDGAIDSLVKNMPPALQGLVGNLADLNAFPTYLASQLFDIRMPLIAGIMAIIIGLGLSVADEEKGELRTILSLPISRTKLFVHKWLAMVTIMGVAIIGLLAGLYITIPFVDGAAIGFGIVMQLVGMTLLVMIAFGSIPFAIGMATGKRAVASAVSIVVIVGSFLLSTFSQAVNWLKDFEKFSLLHYFPAVDIAKESFEQVNIVVYVVVIIVLISVSLICFRRRDVA